MPRIFQYLSKEKEAELKQNAEYIVQPGKGVLAADEPIDSLTPRFEAAQLANNAENRRLYRQLLFTTPAEDFPRHIGGVILHNEAFNQSTDDGTRFVDLLRSRGIMPGINVDGGLVPLDIASQDGQTITQGLDSLAERCASYKKGGAVFAKWRAAFTIGPHAPSYQAIVENSRSLARYAAIAQHNGLVPIVEPDVSLDGDHDLATCQGVTERILSFIYKALMEHHVYLEGTILKPNMCTPGARCPKRASPEEIAAATVSALQRRVPTAVPGIGFLSGGQSELDATLNLNAINRYKHGATAAGRHNKTPWALTFCYGRALQNPVAKIWSGKTENVAAAQKAFAGLIRNNGLASMGKFNSEN